MTTTSPTPAGTASRPGVTAIAGHTLGTPHLAPEDAVRLFARAGLDGAEIIWQDGYLSAIPESGNEDVVAQVAAALDETGLRLVALTPYMTGLNSLDDDARARDLARFRACIADAQRLGGSVVRVYAGTYLPGDEARHDELWARLVAALRELGPVAGDAGVVLAVENHFSTMTTTAAESVALADEVDHPAVGILYDQANLTFTHSEPWEVALPRQAHRIVHVHAKDLVFVDRDRPFVADQVATIAEEDRAVRSRVVGDGEMDWAAIVAALLRAGYAGAMTLEYEYRWHPADLPEPLDGFRLGARRLREYLEAAR